jgi:hypothetical protein
MQSVGREVPRKSEAAGCEYMGVRWKPHDDDEQKGWVGRRASVSRCFSVPNWGWSAIDVATSQIEEGVCNLVKANSGLLAPISM